MRPRVAAVLALVLAVSGCSGARGDDVREVSARFHRALADGDGTAACAMLAPRTRSQLEQAAGRPCAEAVTEEAVPTAAGPAEVQVFGTQAEVRSDRDTLFLARFRDGWKVTAAGCTPRPHEPYDCVLSGG